MVTPLSWLNFYATANTACVRARKRSPQNQFSRDGGCKKKIARQKTVPRKKGGLPTSDHYYNRSLNSYGYLNKESPIVAGGNPVGLSVKKKHVFIIFLKKPCEAWLADSLWREKFFHHS